MIVATKGLCDMCGAPHGRDVRAKFCTKCARERHRERSREWHRERYANDPEYRERERERNSERYANAPEWRERRRERHRERYANDPEYRERHRERNSEWHRERYANDPEYRERRLERNSEWHAAVRAHRNFAAGIMNLHKMKQALAFVSESIYWTRPGKVVYGKHIKPKEVE
jgi:hypothetical protein